MTTLISNKRVSFFVRVVVVIVVLGISSLIGFDGRNSSSETREKLRIDDVDLIINATESYMKYEKSYPQNANNLVDSGYLSHLPTDPTTEKNYTYVRCVVSAKETLVVVAATLEESDTNEEGFSGVLDCAFGIDCWPNASRSPEICDEDNQKVDCSGDLVYCVKTGDVSEE